MTKRTRAPSRLHPVINDGQARMRALGLKGKELAERVAEHPVSISRWLSGSHIPAPEAREKIDRVLGIPSGAWLVAPGSPAQKTHPVIERVRENAAALERRPHKSVAATAADMVADPTVSSVEKIAAAAVCIRQLKEQTEAALDELSDRDRLLAREDVGNVRDSLLATVAAWPKAHAAIAELLAPPDLDGPIGALVEVEGLVGELVAELGRQSERALAVEGIGKASQFDSRRSAALAVQARAGLDDPPEKLIAGAFWRDLVASLGDVLRAHPNALAAVQLGFEDPSPFGADFLARVANVRHIVFPAIQFQGDPVGFVRTILGVEPEPAQIQILESVRDHGRTSCASGRRVGKTDALGMVALWRYACWDEARVFITAPTERQVERVDWICIRRLFHASGVCLACRKEEATRRRSDPSYRVASPCPHSAKLDGTIAEKAKTGLRSGIREVSGFTSKQAEDVQGLAGAEITFIADEASGVKDQIFEAIEGNMSGGGRMLLLGNPTRNEGEHYASFFKKKKFYNSFRISSLTTRNYVEGRSIVRGLATREWVEEMREMHGEESAYFKIHVLGEHAIGEDGRLVSVHTIAEAEERWHSVSDEGDLIIGLDPAGAGGEGDESTFAVRRGDKILEVFARKGLDDEAHVGEVLEILKRHRRDRELAHVVTDTEGVGAGTHAALRQYATTQPLVLQAHGVKSSAGAVREPAVYATVRDEMGAAFAAWIKHGGAIPTDTKLAAEIHVLELKTKLTAKGERVKLIPKDEMRKILRRSPDRYDACALAVWEPASIQAEAPPPPPPVKEGRVPVIDPYATLGGNSAGEIDPYG